MVRSRVSGAVGSSFFPENTQIEFALSGPAVGLPFPVSSPAKAVLVPTPINATTQIATARNRLLLTTPAPPTGRLDSVRRERLQGHTRVGPHTSFRYRATTQRIPTRDFGLCTSGRCPPRRSYFLSGRRESSTR